MTIEKFLQEIEHLLILWIESKFTGQVNIEINMRQGGISKIYMTQRTEIRQI